MDRLAALEAFVRVIEAGSFSGAAKQLRVGQPAVSKTIAQLEDRLGVRLLLRSTHGLTPTDAGRDFYEHAKRSIEDVEEAEAAARGAAVLLSGRLRVNAPVTFARLHVIPRLPIFMAEHPLLDVDVVLDDRDIDLIEAGIVSRCAWAGSAIQVRPSAKSDTVEAVWSVRPPISQRTVDRRPPATSSSIKLSSTSSVPAVLPGPFARGRQKRPSRCAVDFGSARRRGFVRGCSPVWAFRLAARNGCSPLS